MIVSLRSISSKSVFAHLYDVLPTLDDVYDKPETFYKVLLDSILVHSPQVLNSSN